MHAEAVSDALWRLLKRLDRCPDLKSGYLRGGTALALQLGHRRSDDLEFFVPEGVDPTLLLRELGKMGFDITVLNQTSRHTELLIDSLKVDFIREQLPLKQPTKPIHPDIHHLKMADAVDIGFMKLMAIGSRGSRKDFVDLFCPTRNTIPLRSLIDLSLEQDPAVRYSRLLFLKGLVDFEAADQEPDPLMIWDIAWENVKKTLQDEVKEIAADIG